MTNLEHYCYGADQITESDDIKLCMSDSWEDAWWSSKIEDLDDWLVAEYKPYKLTQFEYDLLDSLIDSGDPAADFLLIRRMRIKGYFKEIDLKKTIKEILENCEVISDD